MYRLLSNWKLTTFPNLLTEAVLQLVAISTPKKEPTFDVEPVDLTNLSTKLYTILHEGAFVILTAGG